MAERGCGPVTSQAYTGAQEQTPISIPWKGPAQAFDQHAAERHVGFVMMSFRKIVLPFCGSFGDR